VADGTIFERKGLQTAAIVTDTFQRAGDAMARVQGFVGYRYASMAHPISNLDQEQIRERARSVLPDVLAILGVQPRPAAGSSVEPGREAP
jgi:hypothetical protein